MVCFVGYIGLRHRLRCNALLKLPNVNYKTSIVQIKLPQPIWSRSMRCMAWYRYKIITSTFAGLLIPSHYEAFMAIASEASTVRYICTNAMAAVIRILTLVEIDAFGWVFFVENHSLITAAVETTFEVMTDSSVTRVRSSTLINIW